MGKGDKEDTTLQSCDCGKPRCWGGLTNEQFATRAREEAGELADYLHGRQLGFTPIISILYTFFMYLKQDCAWDLEQDKKLAEFAEQLLELSKE